MYILHSGHTHQLHPLLLPFCVNIQNSLMGAHLALWEVVGLQLWLLSTVFGTKEG